MIIGIVVAIVIVVCCCVGVIAARAYRQKVMEEDKRFFEEYRTFRQQEAKYQDKHTEAVTVVGEYKKRLQEVSTLPASNFDDRRHHEFLGKWEDYLKMHRTFSDGYVEWQTALKYGTKIVVLPEPVAAGAAAGAAVAAPKAKPNAKAKAKPIANGEAAQGQRPGSAEAAAAPETALRAKGQRPPKATQQSAAQRLPSMQRSLNTCSTRLTDMNNDLKSLSTAVSEVLGQAPPEFDFAETGADVRVDEQAEVLKDFSHPLLTRVTVKPYGVLGAGEKEPDPKPGTPIDAVVVDPAGWLYIGNHNNARGAGGASASIYHWLELSKSSHQFPADVHRHFSAAEYEAEKLAKIHKYRDGQHVIHVIGPKVSSIMEGVGDLATAYRNVLSEYCIALAAETSNSSATGSTNPAPDVYGKQAVGPPTGSQKGQPIPKVLRLLPISSGIFLQDKRLDAHMPQITWAALSMALVMLPVAAQELLKTVMIEVCIFQQRQVQIYEESLKAKQAPHLAGKMDLRNLPNSGQAPNRNGTFDWLRTKNGPVDRLNRLATCLTTQQAIWCGSYTLNDSKLVELKPLTAMLNGTKVRKATDQSPAGLGAVAKTPKITHDSLSTTMEVAQRTQSSKRPTVAVSAASAYQVGGGCLTGGRHAQEETWCTMTTLLKSLQQVHWETVRLKGAGQGATLDQHIPVDGCIVSPSVQIFRDTSTHGYAFQANPTTLLAVCSMAMFNQNRSVRDSPEDSPEDFETYCRQVRMKFRAVLETAAELKAEVLVTSDVGCGVFENDPVVVGTLFGEALKDGCGSLVEVIVTGKKEFADAVQRAASSQGKVPLRPPPYFSEWTSYNQSQHRSADPPSRETSAARGGLEAPRSGADAPSRDHSHRSGDRSGISRDGSDPPAVQASSGKAGGGPGAAGGASVQAQQPRADQVQPQPKSRPAAGGGHSTSRPGK